MKIFISISCHDDVDVIETVKSLKANAVNPEQLRIVVVLQTDQPEKFAALTDAEVHTFPLSWVTGCGKPRFYAFQQLADEELFLQLDCHMRFQPGWDQAMLSEWQACPDHERAVLNILPAGFVISTGELLSMKTFYPKLDQFKRNIPLASLVEVDPTLPEPPQIPLAAAGFMLCTAAAIKAAPPDPYYHFDGEELSQSLRLWTHGYNIYACRRCITHHAYRTENPRAKTVFNDDVRHHRFSIQRIDSLLDLKPQAEIPEVCKVEFDKFGLGADRTVSAWEDMFGVLLKEKRFR